MNKVMIVTWVRSRRKNYVKAKIQIYKFISTYLSVTKNVERPDFLIISSIVTIAKSSLMYLPGQNQTFFAVSTRT
jgi:hypothetical protein